ncbi:MAG: DUF393 domain-containing protein [Bacteroidetes bacterium]|nr:DUF393 domain-containing protein [Bacteroidota bacterium]
MASEHFYPVLLFDGICNYCNRWVNFIIRHDKKKKFRFTTLQSEVGKKILKEHAVSVKEESAVLIYNNKVYLQSSAGLHILYHLGGIYSLAFVFIIVPAFIRNFCYNLIARNRYKWWGKRSECMIPSDGVKDRFL